MSYADEVLIRNLTDILENGVSDEGCTVRPKWEDGTPAHTIKKFAMVNRYDLGKEFPITTLRRTAFKSAVDELLWIWQKNGRNGQHRQGVRLPALRQAPLSRGHVRPG